MINNISRHISRREAIIVFLFFIFLTIGIMTAGCNGRGGDKTKTSKNGIPVISHESTGEKAPATTRKLKKSTGAESHNTGTPSSPEDPLPTTSFGDKKYLNLPLPENGKEESGSSGSIYYKEEKSTKTAQDDFILSEWKQPVQPEFVIDEWKELPPEQHSGNDKTPKPMDEFTPYESSETPESPKPSGNIQKSPTENVKGNTEEPSMEEELRQAEAEKEKAFVHYTRLATTGGEGDINKALKEYREAAARVKELKKKLGR